MGDIDIGEWVRMTKIGGRGTVKQKGRKDREGDLYLFKI